MLEILQFVFSSFWVFLGTLILLPIVIKGFIALIALTIVAIRGGDINVK